MASANILNAVAKGAAWPVVSKLLQAEGVPKAQADITAKQMVTGQAPPPPVQVQASLMDQIPWMWVAIGGVAIVAVWMMMGQGRRR